MTGGLSEDGRATIEWLTRVRCDWEEREAGLFGTYLLRRLAAEDDDRLYGDPSSGRRIRVTLKPHVDNAAGLEEARKRGWPTEPFEAVLDGQAPWLMWSRVRLDDGTVLDLPPMYVVTRIADDASAELVAEPLSPPVGSSGTGQDSSGPQTLSERYLTRLRDTNTDPVVAERLNAPPHEPAQRFGVGNSGVAKERLAEPQTVAERVGYCVCGDDGPKLDCGNPEHRSAARASRVDAAAARAGLPLSSMEGISPGPARHFGPRPSLRRLWEDDAAVERACRAWILPAEWRRVDASGYTLNSFDKLRMRAALRAAVEEPND